MTHKLRGIRDSLPQGYVLGRVAPGNGPPDIVKLTDVARSPAIQGAVQQVVGNSVSLGSLNVLANPTGALARATGVTVTALLDFLTGAVATAAARGSVLFRGAAGWSLLGPGSVGQVLTTGGAGADPSWGVAGSYIPLSLGAEPGTIVTDGAGDFITIPYVG